MPSPDPLADSDRAARATALDCARSAIVQAPAGSGKTELLAQRVLALLARVDAPEEIVAITFTRKAAAEMRHRILRALGRAEGPEPRALHERQTWSLARGALARDAELGWNLAAHPSRLAIATFDSLCSGLARQLPVTSRLGALPAIVEDARALHEIAAQRTLAAGAEDALLERAWSTLLDHLDNDVGGAVGLLAEMLARREQWLLLVAGGGDLAQWRRELEAALAAEATRVVAVARAAFPAAEIPALLELAAWATERMEDRPAAAAIAEAAASLESASPCSGAAWAALADWLLTGTGGFRSRFTRAQGFPPKSGATKAAAAQIEARKSDMGALVERLAADPRLAPTLHRVRSLPPPAYDDAQWAVVGALLAILRRAAAELDVLFAERGVCDFPGVAIAAQRALGSAEGPTDLLQALDTRIRHVLVDEFQDTSRAQFALLETLTAGWEPADGRTLFLVGDPMQSVYRFRQAEVALFARARAHGLGGVPLQPVQLAFNFRSVPAIVRWVNATFAIVFGRVPDTTTDHVEYAAATPSREGEGEVRFHLEPDDEDEARRVASVARDALRGDPAGTVAVLVRSRAHLAEVVPALRRAGLAFQAVEIDSLRERQGVLDLLALAQALRHPADRHSWLALLRGPLVGLSLAELLALAPDERTSVLAQIGTEAALARLAPDAAQRTRRFAAQMRRAAAARDGSFAARVESTWMALGGPSALEDDSDLVAAQQFFAELRAFETAEGVADWSAFRRRIDALYAPPDPAADGRLQLLTIHKAKGLQFDTVIVPGITRRTARGQAKLLRWRSGGARELLLAPINPRDDRREPIHAYLQSLEALDEDAEVGRLLYVAATRAKHALHWIGVAPPADPADPDPYAPPAGTLLAKMWPAVGAALAAGMAATGDSARTAATSRGVESTGCTHADAGSGAAARDPGARGAAGAQEAPSAWLRRVSAAWQPEALPADVPLPAGRVVREGGAEPAPPFDWAREVARHVGTVTHRHLLQIGRDGLARWSPERVRERRGAIAVGLRQAGVTAADLAAATDRVVEALARTLSDPRGRWLFADDHRSACSELALSAAVGGEVVRIVVDRTFVDAAGTRWIVDFKTSAHEGADVDAFLANEVERYRPQLARYARILSRLGPEPIRVGLYHPLLGGWRDWLPTPAELASDWTAPQQSG